MTGAVARGVAARAALALLAGSILASALGAEPAPAAADSLREALSATYMTSPVLNAQREALKGTDAGVAIAGAQARPQVAATVGVNRDLTRSGVLVTDRSKGPILSGGLELNLPLFTGGRVRNSVEAAKAEVEAGRATLKAVEGEVFAEAVEVYMDVLRDRAIAELNENQVRVLTENLRATNGLYGSGDLTRTDIAQSQARLSGAKAQLALAQARLTVSEESYLRVTGQLPGALAAPPPLPPLPASASEAAKIAKARNMRLVAAQQQARAAGLGVRIAAAERLPSLSGVVGGDYVNYTGESSGVGTPRAGTQTTVGLTTRIPLYQGGAPSARIRQARAAEARLLEQAMNTERVVVANVRSAFVTYQAALKAIQSNEEAVSANELALRGARAERRVGTRTVIEVLNAEQELLNSQVQLIAARRDAYVAGFDLLEAMGQASYEDLGLEGGTLYDPTGNYKQVAGTWSDWAEVGEHRMRSTPTLKIAEGAPDHLAKAEPSPVPPASPAPSEAPVAVAAANVEEPPAPVPASAPVSAPPTGRWAIQLGSFRRPGAPQALFAKLAGRIGDKQPIYQQSGGFTRLLVGPYATPTEARSACRTLGPATPCQILKQDR